ncbi:hypothetical protein OBBRIDRAFT_794048 [Obba rivulosa]|uniref:Uncharacterized protein n=1 Tax=Obba rivulosa TaxID=1052685 RepID=A0A8E2DIS5_9APHY|nr:hypothetical protein OBBRIDRAFT_794048 [Obba rivulosa]
MVKVIRGASQPEEYTMSQFDQRAPSPQSSQDSQSASVSNEPVSLPSLPASPESLAQPMNFDLSHHHRSGNIAAPAHFVNPPEPSSATPLNAGAPPWIVLDEIKFQPMSPSTLAFWRYEGRTTVPGDGGILLVESMEIGPWDSPISDWEICIHPEGQRYFRRKQQAVYTEQDLEDPNLLNNVNQCVESLLKTISHRDKAPSDLEVAIYISGDSEVKTGLCAHYYLVTEATRAVCWLQDVSVQLVTNNQSPVHSKVQLKYAHEAQYWAHRELYPNHWTISKKILTELSESLCYATVDSKTSDTSTTPWDAQTARDHLDIVEKIDPATSTGYSVCIIARLMHNLARERFQHYHGQRWARLNRNQSVKEDLKQRPYQRSLWFLFLLSLCFYLPDQYLEELESIFVDRLVNYKPWNRFITGLKRDWADNMVPGTVLLAANVGFLAIQSVDTNDPIRSVAQIASYCSTVFSLGSIVMCIILSRQHRQSGQTCDVESATHWLEAKAGKPWRAELLTITLSLPSVWFTWGVISFCVALLWVCFDQTSGATIGAVAGVAIPTLVVVAWVIIVDWKHKHRSTYLTGRISDALRLRWKETRKKIVEYWTQRGWTCVRSKPSVQTVSDKSSV